MRIEIDSLALDRRATARIVEASEHQVSIWVRRYEIFPEKRQGTGYHFHFTFRDIMALAAMTAMIELGVSPEKAASGIRSFGGPYRDLLNGNGVQSFAPRADGGLTAAYGSHLPASIKIQAKPLFDRVFPRFRAEILEGFERLPKAELAAALDEFEAGINAIVADRG